MKKLPIKTIAYAELEQSYKEWLARLGYSQSSVNALPYHVREFLHWLEKEGKMDLSQVQSDDLSTFMIYFKSRSNERSGGGLSMAHINKQRFALKLLCEYLKITGQAEWELQVGYYKKEPIKERLVLNREQIEKLYQSCGLDPLGQRDRAMLSIYYGCGLRRQEGVNLELEDVLFERRLLHIRKTKNSWERYVPMAERVRQDLERYIYGGRKLHCSQQSPAQVFLTDRGKGISGVTMMRRLKDLAKLSGAPESITLHSLRHSIATHLVESGLSVEEVADFLGHRALDSSQIYVHPKTREWKNS